MLIQKDKCWFKTDSKRQKTAEATGDLDGNKIGNYKIFWDSWKGNTNT